MRAKGTPALFPTEHGRPRPPVIPEVEPRPQSRGETIRDLNALANKGPGSR